MTAELIAQFEELVPASTDGTFNAVPTNVVRGDFLGKDHQGFPVFLIADNGLPSYRPTVRHQYVCATFGVNCRFIVDGAEQTGAFALFGFVGEHQDLNPLFISCVQAAIADLPTSVGGREIEEKIMHLLNLFQALSRPSTREVAGLWAELLCILHSTAPKLALSRWHSDNFQTHDFSWGSTSVEVKATMGQVRAHDFSLAQLTMVENRRGYVISLMLRPANRGSGVMAIAQAIEASLGGDIALREKLWSQILQALGKDFSTAIDKRFDEADALKRLKIFGVADIPSIQMPLDPRITSVRFKVDLTDTYKTSDEHCLLTLEKILGRI